MLLLHQTGAVHVGEIVRYTVTYTPSLDRILPPPSHLHVKIKNTSAIPLRAAYLHGPYTLYVSCYPSTFDPNTKHIHAKEEGEPSYEPQLKAGGHWSSKLTVPESIRQSAGLSEHRDGEPRPSFTWIIEVASQVLFSTTASVHYELLVGRDEKSVSLGFTGVVSNAGAPGRLEDHQQAKPSPHTQTRGVFTKAVKLRVDDTTSLWSSPAFPSHDETSRDRPNHQKNHLQQDDTQHDPKRRKGKKRKKIHLVIISHGLHSNLGADMLYMKESIDATAKQARKDARNAKKDARLKKAQEQDFGRTATDQRTKSAPELVLAPTPDFDNSNTKTDDGDPDNDDDDDDAEEILVRGFNGNAVKTEKGIQYLGKRLAKYVLSITYPDQPYLPVKSTITQSISRTFTGAPKPTQIDGRQPSHKHSTIAKDESASKHDLAYRITSISFVGHSLGGLVQTYAVAYIQKHSPEFFEKIKPINFVAMATPFLGLSNENPMYIKFALDFGLVGRTGQDLGLTWRAPTIARNSWGAMVGGFSSGDNKDKEEDPGTKPLLRILPTGPAHVALKMFRNRSVYSNVVNDGIVPLRTSCLLFLDWRGLDRVEKARRDNGLVGTMVNWGIMELIGQNVSAPRRGFLDDLFSDSGDESNKPTENANRDPGSAVPQAEASLGLDKDTYDLRDGSSSARSSLAKRKPSDQPPTTNLWSTFTNFFRPQAGTQKIPSPKQQRIFERSQTMNFDQVDSSSAGEEPAHRSGSSSSSNHRKLLVRGSSLYTNNSDNESYEAPPRTTVFESAGDLLNPPLPPKEFLMDPEARPRTIFHDRVYHPEDIPPPPAKRQRTFMRNRPNTSDEGIVPDQAPEDLSKISASKTPDQGGIRIEEKIARAYHRDMAWRKVLVRLEPDAHNNIIVRRMFANAYGWPVVKHMCDTHFGYTKSAITRDQDEAPVERAKPQKTPVGKDGEEVRNQTQLPEDVLNHDPKSGTPQRATSTESMPTQEDHVVDTLHLRQKNIQKLQSQQGTGYGLDMQAISPTSAVDGNIEYTSRDIRSQSELRESRDHLSDLISMVSVQGEPNQSYSSMHSGTAALHRLSRQDSARWSDRFFESDEDEDSGEDEKTLNDELRKAYDRGVALDNNPDSSRSSLRNQTHDGGSQQGKQVHHLLSSKDSKSKLVNEPESMESSRRGSSISAVPLDQQTLSLTGVGLGRSVGEILDEQGPLSPSAVRGGSADEGASSGGVVEQVVKAQQSSARTESGKAKRPDIGGK